MSRLTIIVAATTSNGIGVGGRLPWRLPKEMRYFAKVTSQAPEGKRNAVLMGRNTWESIPKKFRPLPNRLNVVISRNKEYALYVAFFIPQTVLSSVRDGQAVLAPNFEGALAATEQDDVHRNFIIGGAQLYTETLSLADRVLMTRIVSPAFEECDVKMPDFLALGHWRQASHKELETWVGFDVVEGEKEENGVRYEFQMWVRE